MTQTWYEGQQRHDTEEQPCNDRTRFDLASLTKPLTTTMAALKLIGEGSVDWETEIGELLPVTSDEISRCPLWRLMNHTAGLPAHRRYFEGLGASSLHQRDFDRVRRMIDRMILNTDIEHTPGSKELYSDISYLLLQNCLNSAGFDLLSDWPTLPHHGPDKLHFRPITADLSPGPYAATELCPWRKKLMVGEVHDDNCWSMGGVAGHAGLFGTLNSVLDFGRMWLHILRGQRTECSVPGEILRRSVSWRWMHAQGTRVLGWDTPTRAGRALVDI